MKVLANDGISDSGKELLRKAGFELVEHQVAQEQLVNFINENGIGALLVRSATQVPAELIDSCPTLKIIGRGGVGMDNIAVDHARAKGLHVINTPAASTRSVAEMVFAHFFALARNLHESNRLMPLEGETKFNTLKKSFSKSVELKGKTLGVIGMGRIGMEVASIGISLGMKVRMFARTERTESIRLSFFDGREISFDITSEPLESVLKNADFLSINTPKTDGYLLDEAEFDQMKNGVFVVNTARGGVLNEVALLNAIDNKKVAGAALDVFESEPKPELALLMNTALSLSPHIAGSTVEAQERVWTELVEQILTLQS
ncbi:MAG: 3-phosphoglycerate dehydrogenase [Chryseobacterium sp.]|nr:MAG: 3-phosphoglycerate dehydrogenase [Chryseobacterium sp.]